MALLPQHIETIETDFSNAERARVIAELGRITPDHTWQSQYNLDKATSTISASSRCDLKELSNLVDAVLVDFRDVIYWWVLEQEKIFG